MDIMSRCGIQITLQLYSWNTMQMSVCLSVSQSQWCSCRNNFCGSWTCFSLLRKKNLCWAPSGVRCWSSMSAVLTHFRLSVVSTACPCIWKGKWTHCFVLVKPKMIMKSHLGGFLLLDWMSVQTKHPVLTNHSPWQEVTRRAPVLTVYYW